MNYTNLHKDSKLIFKNFSYFSLLRAFNIISQYLLVSFLVRTLGQQTYGEFVWTFSIVQYLIIFINFGFNTYAAKYISEKSIVKKEVDRIFSGILYIKLTLFILSTFFLLGSLYIIPELRSQTYLFLVLLGFALGEALFPIWFFQGMEKMKTPTKIVFVFKFILVLSTLVLISAPEDVLGYAFLLSTSQFFIGLSGIYMVLRHYNTHIVVIPFHLLWQLIKEGFIFFLGSLCSKTLNLFVLFMAGICFTMQDVAGFDISFKIIAAFQLPFETLSMALFPTIARTRDKAMNQKIISFATIIAFLLWGLTYWQTDTLLTIMGGNELQSYAHVLRSLSMLIPIVVISYFLGTNTLVAFGYNREFNLSIILPSIFYILTLLSLWYLDAITIQLVLYIRIAVELIMMSIRFGLAFKNKLIFVQ